MFGLNNGAYKMAKSLAKIYETRHKAFNILNLDWNLVFEIKEEYLISDLNGFKTYIKEESGEFYFLVIPSSFRIKTFTVVYNPQCAKIRTAHASVRWSSLGIEKPTSSDYRKYSDIDMFIEYNEYRPEDIMSVMIHECTHLTQFDITTSGSYYSSIRDISFKGSKKIEKFYREITDILYYLSDDELNATVAELVYETITDNTTFRSALRDRIIEAKRIDSIYEEIYMYSAISQKNRDELRDMFSFINYSIKNTKQDKYVSLKDDYGVVDNVILDVIDFFKETNSRKSYNLVETKNFISMIEALRVKINVLTAKADRRYNKVINMSLKQKTILKEYIK